MSINNYLLGNINSVILEAAEGYSDNNVMSILAENSYNYAAIVRASIIGDMKELILAEDSAELCVLQEANVGGFFDGIKQFFIKLGQKIKGMFEKVIVRIRSLFMSKRDFVKKYTDKFITNNLEDMKVNWREPQQWDISIDDIVKFDTILRKFDTMFGWDYKNVDTNNFRKYDDKSEAIKDADGNKIGTKVTKGERIPRNYDKVIGHVIKDSEDDETIKDKYYKECLEPKFNSITSADDFKKEVFDILFDPKGKDSNAINSSVKTNILRILGNDKLITSMEKDKSNNEKTIKALLKIIDKARDEAIKNIKDGNMNIANELTGSSKRAHMLGNLYSLAAGTAIAANKFLVQQSYSIFVKAVNYTKKNEETLLDAIEDCAFNEAAEELNEEYTY